MFRKKILRKSIPRIICIGDSWFNLKMFSLRRDARYTTDYLKKDYDFTDCSIPGYRLVDESYYRLYRIPLEFIEKNGEPITILLSIGGNDLIEQFERFVEGNGAQGRLNKKRINDMIRNFIFPKFYKYLLFMVWDICGEKVDIKDAGNRIRIIMHGYDYFHPEKRALSDYQNIISHVFNDRKIPEDLADRIVRDFVDTINEQFKKLLKPLKVIKFIDLRGRIPKDYWSEQIHPTPEGYMIVSEAFAKTMEAYGVKKRNVESTDVYRRPHNSGKRTFSFRRNRPVMH